jgi:hypothetical protein
MGATVSLDEILNGILCLKQNVHTLGQIKGLLAVNALMLNNLLVRHDPPVLGSTEHGKTGH